MDHLRALTALGTTLDMTERQAKLRDILGEVEGQYERYLELSRINDIAAIEAAPVQPAVSYTCGSFTSLKTKK